MQREIKFRGKLKKTNDWAYGCFVKTRHYATGVDLYKIVTREYTTDFDDVIPETVGQFTGLKDKNGTEIYEGDILQYSQQQYIVRFGSYDLHTGYNFKKGNYCANRFYLEGIKIGAWENLVDNIYQDILCENGYAFIYLREENQYGGNFEKYNQEWGLEVVGNIHDNEK